MSRARLLALVLVPLAAGCGSSAFDVPPRALGVRAPLTATCDAQDPLRCALPWPSSTFLRVDPKSATGVRVEVSAEASPGTDDTSSLDLADGFSRVTELATGYAAKLDAGTLDGAVRLFEVGKDGAPVEVPLKSRLVEDSVDGEETLLIARPLRPLAAATDCVAVVLDSLRAVGGGALPVSRPTLLATGRAQPATLAEAKLAAYHAPTRALLARLNISPAHVLRVWDFTTRSKEDSVSRLTAMRRASAAAGAQARVAFDKVELPTGGAREVVIEGRLLAMPLFSPRGVGWTLDASELPIAQGTSDVPFRIVIPRGEGDYRVDLYGHGTGGSFEDTAFDEDIAGLGLAKVAVNFWGWTGDEVIGTLTGFGKMFAGSSYSTARLAQGLADLAGVESALAGRLGDALAGAKLGDVDNPAAGRRPDVREPLWTGGSLGGTIGFVESLADPSIHASVLNVPGAAWTHFMPSSDLYTLVAKGLLPDFGTSVDMELALLMSQGNWDDVDGATWVDAIDHPMPVFLVQESMGDPILPNPGTEMVAAAVHATQVGAVLAPVTGAARADRVEGASALTQYKVPDGVKGLDIHGFAARDTPAGVAAREQIREFLDSALAGAPVITIPPGCVANGGSCDFSSSP